MQLSSKKFTQCGHYWVYHFLNFDINEYKLTSFFLDYSNVSWKHNIGPQQRLCTWMKLHKLHALKLDKTKIDNYLKKDWIVTKFQQNLQKWRNLYYISFFLFVLLKNQVCVFSCKLLTITLQDFNLIFKTRVWQQNSSMTLESKQLKWPC